MERFADAARVLAAAADSGDTAALAELAHWRIAGNIIGRNLAAARDLLGRAAEAGNDQAALLHTAFLAAGVGGSDMWQSARDALGTLAEHNPQAEAQVRLLDLMKIGADGFPERPVTARVLSETPYVAVAKNFLTDAECKHLRQAGETALEPSLVVDPHSGRMVPHPIRTSDGATIGVFSEDLVVNALNRRIASLSNTALAQGEALQLLRYRQGHEYRPHMDALPAETNQRILTVLLYLSDDYQGGETAFPRTGLTFRGRRGDALLFRNVISHGRPDPMSLHAGLPVTSGMKLIATRWIREHPFTFPPPRPILNGN